MASTGDAANLPSATATDNLRHFCTLRKNNLSGDANDGRHLRPEGSASSSNANSSADADRIGRFCTVRGGSSKAIMGNVNGGQVGASGYDGNSDEVNRNLLYAENMCTFENFCEKSLEQQGEDGETTTAGSESIENFCTLRKKRQQKSVGAAGSGSSKVHETSLVDGEGSNPVGSYCTLKKKKLKLNQRFVESFLEDPNAKLHDYLSELDAYLDEMDGLDSYGEDDEDEGETTATAKEESSVDSEPEMVGEDTTLEVVFKKCEDQISYIDVKNFCTLPKKKRVQFLNAFNRGGPLRRTFAAPSDGGATANGRNSGLIRREVIAEAEELSAATDRDSMAAGTSREDYSKDFLRYGPDYSEPTSTATLDRRSGPPRRTSTWLRNSMRKTRPIDLPSMVQQNQQHQQPDSIITSAPIVECRNSIIDPTTSGSTAHASPYSTESLSLQSVPSGSSCGASLDHIEDHNELSSIATLPASDLEISEQTKAYSEASGLVAAAAPITEDELIPYLVSASLCEREPPRPLETNLDSPTQTNQRPRQTGRRSEVRPRVVSITAERDAATNQLIIRTNSVPASSSEASSPPHYRTTSTSTGDSHHLHHHNVHQFSNNNNNSHHQHQHHHRYGGMGSETSSIGSSRNPSPVSLLSTTTFSSIASGVDTDRSRSRPDEDGRDAGASSVGGGAESTTATSTNATTTTRNGSFHSTTIMSGGHEDGDETDTSDEEDSEPEMDRNGRPKPMWPHVVSRSMATSFCALGLFNISRFAIFSIHFGANFIVQFLIFSFLFGIPMLWLQMVLGARIRGGPVTMWRISPICKGIGIALILTQGLIALYSAISLSWVLVYFRDSFVSRSEKYRWQEIFELYRGPGNQSFRLSDTVADYFNGVVLQRYQLGPGGRGVTGIGAVRFQLAFNLAILWTFVFVVLCKGIRSFGKIVIGLYSFAMTGLIAICVKFLSMVNYDSLQNLFPATEWQDFFLNSRSWMSAAQETFLTWGLLGISVYSINCRTNRKGGPRRTRRELRRDALVVVVLTLAGLMLAAVFGSACVQILNSRGYYYFPGSYENIGTDIFLLPSDQPLPPQHATMPTKWLIRYSMVLGESFKRPYANPHQESGYQVLRLVTELFPSTLAAATQERIAPIWSLIGFLTLLLFGLGQLCAMWKPIAGAIGDSPSSIVLSCVTGLFMGIPLATESGITIIHYLDTVLGGAWWILLLWIGHILAIFLVRGRPYTSDLLVNDLRLTQSLSAFIAFAWNFLLPIGMIFLCILEYRVSNANSLFNWKHGGYWPLWARQVGGFIQVAFLLLVPIVTVVQIYRYLSKGPPDILERFDRLLRPSINGSHGASSVMGRMAYGARPAPPLPVRTINNSGSTMISLESRPPQDDAPPKYTPPPSYTTATGARIAKMLRNSIRRSVRRIMGEPSGNRQRGAIITTQQQTNSANPAGDELPPPDYSSILTDVTHPGGGPNLTGIEMGPRVLYNSETLSGRRRHRSLTPHSPNLTATDVLQILRPATVALPPQNGSSTLQRTPSYVTSGSGALGYGNVDLVVRNTLSRRHSIGSSVENLVLGAAPIGDSSIITLAVEEDPEHLRNRGGNDSVI